jgi:prepilin-type N-terminal cleavage/methylation domain-containing protein
MVSSNSRLFIHKKSGFTLIELLVVISIMGLLSTVVLATLGIARQRATDARKMSEVLNVDKALRLFYDSNKKMPLNNYIVAGKPTNACDYPNPIDSEQTSSRAAYLASMQELVTGKTLASVPRTPNGSTAPYCYLDVGANNPVGAMFWTQLSVTPTKTPEGTCPIWLGFADMNDDGIVDSTSDYPAWSAYLGMTNVGNPKVDFNKDGTVDIPIDRAYVTIKINHSPLPCTQTPSPSNDFCSCADY